MVCVFKVHGYFATVNKIIFIDETANFDKNKKNSLYS